MGQFSSFDSLPVVVHDGILRSLASPRDVANLIRASPGTLQAYMTNSRKSVRLAVMQNSLTLENQHLMNLVMAAPQATTATNVELDGVSSRDDFNKAVSRYLQSFHCRDPLCSDHGLQHLTLNTYDYSIRLFLAMDKAVQTYSTFTMARAQSRVNRMCGTFSTDFRKPAPVDRETQRVWRGFLLYELFCIMWGMPQISANAAGNWNNITEQAFTPIADLFLDLPTRVLEEFLCVRQYVHEQCELQVNQVLQRFRFTVQRMGRRFSGTRSSDHPWKLNRTTLSLSEINSPAIPDPLRYFVNDWFVMDPPDKDDWVNSMALLGPSFLQDFLSRDATGRLDFFRATVPFSHQIVIRSHHSLFTSRISLHDLNGKHLALGKGQNSISVDMILRLRAVGWIFWDNPERLSSMYLVPGSLDVVYGPKGAFMIFSRLEHPDGAHLDERPREPEGWEPVVQEFGTLVTQDQRDRMARLFQSVGSLRFSEVTSVLTGSRDQTVGGDGTEVSHSDD